jgi:hypothetical protein
MTRIRFIFLFMFSLLMVLITGCGTPGTDTAPPSPTATDTPTPEPTSTLVPERTEVFFDLDHPNQGLTMNSGGDVDTEIISVHGVRAFRSGNGAALPSEDGNDVSDFYIQFRVDDDFIYRGNPTSRVNVVVEYLDEGSDRFNIQYDGLSGGPQGNGKFKDSGVVFKTDTGELKTAVIPICDANFGNRDQDSDFRISDHNDGAETIHRITVVKVTEEAGPAVINVDSCGANPFDDQPDSDAIQACINQTCSGDTIVFTSPGDDPDYQGYLIDKTIFLVHPTVKTNLTFTSTDPDDHALLTATADLKGFVAHLFSRSTLGGGGEVDDITVIQLDFDGNRDERLCFGKALEGQDWPEEDGENDNWGSWLPECTNPGDPWCSAGTLSMYGAVGIYDFEQDYQANPEIWSTGLTVKDVSISNTECATALSFHGAAGRIDSVIIDTAGEHTHAPGCTLIDQDEDAGAWSDGITFEGPAHIVTRNTISDASDVGIVFFGGRDTIITNNLVQARPGNHGMFAAIAVHPWTFGWLPGIEVTGNQVINDADELCGGIHAGINIGGHPWNAGCRWGGTWPSTVGAVELDSNGNQICTSLSPPPGGLPCPEKSVCRIWGHIPEGETLILSNNAVSGAQINYLVEGLEVIGELIVSNNISDTPRMTDWQGAKDCTWDGITNSWGTLDYVAHDPTIQGWTDQRIYCER